MRVPRRYSVGARFYDVLSGEPVYRVGRERAIALLGLGPGDRVLDVGCGTGLNLPLLHDRVGPTGVVVGVDRSREMLDRARRRSADWGGVSLVEADAGDPGDLGAPTFDAMIATYALSIVVDWRAAWKEAVDRVRPGGRVAVVDLALPSGPGTVLAPLAALACLTGGVHRERQVWRLVEALEDVTVERHRQGHVVVAVGTVPQAAA